MSYAEEVEGRREQMREEVEIGEEPEVAGTRTTPGLQIWRGVPRPGGTSFDPVVVAIVPWVSNVKISVGQTC